MVGIILEFGVLLGTTGSSDPTRLPPKCAAKTAAYVAEEAAKTAVESLSRQMRMD